MMEKQKPWRSKGFMAFCHREMSPAPCCVCGEKPWVALHHFGEDGGQGMKPSDNEVARVCVECHMAFDLKRFGLIKSKHWEILASYERDALRLNRAYIEHIMSARKDDDATVISEECALNELNMWLVTECQALSLEQQRDWLLGWANRRAANVIEFLAQPMREIAMGIIDGESVPYVARRALQTACL